MHALFLLHVLPLILQQTIMSCQPYPAESVAVSKYTLIHACGSDMLTLMTAGTDGNTMLPADLTANAPDL